MSEENGNVEVKVKPSAGTKVTFKAAGYVPGMESDSEFEGIAFMRLIPAELKGDITAINKLRSNLIAEKCKQYGVKPLGATSAPTSGPTKKEIAMIQALGDLTNDNAKIAKVMLKKTGKTFTTEEIAAILA
jgi:hypothetical protein